MSKIHDGYVSVMSINNHNKKLKIIKTKGEKITMPLEYQQLVDKIAKRHIITVTQLRKYIYNNKSNLANQYPNLFGEVVLSNGNMIYNGLTPDYFKQVCHDLKLKKEFSRVKAINFNYKLPKTNLS